jgi:hypothetical protein
VFKDVRFIGNTRADPCSKVLKRDIARKWRDERFNPADTTIYLGMEVTEMRRQTQVCLAMDGWKVEFPLNDEPHMGKFDMMRYSSECGIVPPRLYLLGFKHNNCGGFCCKMGHKSAQILLKGIPARFAFNERKESDVRQYLGKDVSILRDRRKGTTTVLTLEEFRRRLANNEYTKEAEIDDGECSCFMAPSEEVA